MTMHRSAITLLLLSGMLVACGTPEERAADYLAKAQAYFDEGDYERARLEAGGPHPKHHSIFHSLSQPPLPPPLSSDSLKSSNWRAKQKKISEALAVEQELRRKEKRVHVRGLVAEQSNLPEVQHKNLTCRVFFC